MARKRRARPPRSNGGTMGLGLKEAKADPEPAAKNPTPSQEKDHSEGDQAEHAQEEAEKQSNEAAAVDEPAEAPPPPKSNVPPADAEVPAPGLGLEVIRRRYPHLAHAATDLDPAHRPLFDRALLRMPGAMARALDDKIKKYFVAKVNMNLYYQKIQKKMLKATIKFLW
uniref:Uncharacterized protein n=1 Tax=Arundo donax TaxID=35708 RepID=A0A0A9G4C0_ARUDO